MTSLRRTKAAAVEKIPSHRSDELPVYIQIDRQPFAVDAWTLTGAELRYLPNPPVSDDYDLWHHNPFGPDEIALPESVIDLRGGRFFTAPKIINAGASAHIKGACNTDVPPVTTLYDPRAAAADG